MGVYIKGMEMPKSCESCPCKTADAFGGLGCQATGYIPLRKANQDRPDNCPFIPVPPHGRLIDADAFLQTIRPITYEDSTVACSIKTLKSVFNELISNAPTIIPAEPPKEETE